MEYEQACGDKVPDTMSIRDRLRQKEQVVKIREAGRIIGQDIKIKGRGSKGWEDGIRHLPGNFHSGASRSGGIEDIENLAVSQ